MKTNLQSHITIALMMVMYSSVLLSQKQSFNDIYKLCEAKKYKEAIPQLKEFIKDEPKHFASHYELGKGYAYLWHLAVEQQNKNANLQNRKLWNEQDYQNNIKLWEDCIKYTDSTIFFYKDASALIDIKFLQLDLRYPELSKSIEGCGVLMQVKCARKYFSDRVTGFESVNATNVATYTDVKKDYEAFKKKGEGKQSTVASSDCLCDVNVLGNEGDDTKPGTISLLMQ